MADPHTGNIERATAEAEHISPSYTGDNISAKKVAGYIWDGNNWVRASGGLLPLPFDDLQFSNPDSNGNYQTATVKSATVTVATLTLTYDSSSKLIGVTRT